MGRKQIKHELPICVLAYHDAAKRTRSQWSEDKLARALLFRWPWGYWKKRTHKSLAKARGLWQCWDLSPTEKTYKKLSSHNIFWHKVELLLNRIKKLCNHLKICLYLIRKCFRLLPFRKRRIRCCWFPAFQNLKGCRKSRKILKDG